MKNILPQFRLKQVARFLFTGLLLIQTITFSVQPVLTQDAVEPSTENPSSESSDKPNADKPPTTTDEPVLEPDDQTVPTETFVFNSDLIIKAINPGYTVEKVRDVGELIELQKLSNVPSFSLAGYSLRYTNSSGTSTTLLNFSEGSFMTGEFLLMRLARSSGSGQADATYMTTLAMATGKVELLYHDTVVDEICWASKDELCATSFKSAQPTTLVRNLTTGGFEHLEVYEPNFDPAKPALVINSPPTNSNQNSNPSSAAFGEPVDSEEVIETPTPVCYGLEFSEIHTFYADNASEQFIELYNPTERTITIDACTIRYKKKIYPLSGNLKPNTYHTIRPSNFTPTFSLTKNPTTSNTVELLDADESVVDILVYNHGQKKSTSYAKFYDLAGEEFWQQTYALTPGQENIYQEFRSCPAGKVINPATGNCVKVVSSTETTAECPAGKYRNPLTGRCKNLETATEPKPCAEGYERNPETNRCRKVTAPNDGAEYALIPETHSESSTFVAFGIVILLVLLGTFYVILQFRHEIARAGRKSRHRLHHISKNLVARCRRLRRDK